MNSIERRPEPMLRPRTTYGLGIATGVAGALILPGVIAGAAGFIALSAFVAVLYLLGRGLFR